jgi:hypothetical protein
MSMRDRGFEEPIRNQIIDASRPSKSGNVYFIGPFARRVNFMSQQARALNLIWALSESGAIPSPRRVAIVGAGLTGLTATVALLAKKCDVSVFERNHTEICFQAISKHRFVHPTINYWPETELNPTTNLPFLDWISGPCSEVMKSILEEWRSKFSDKIECMNTGFTVTHVEDDGTRVFVEGTRTSDTNRNSTPFTFGPFDLVIFATGFGAEKSLSRITCRHTGLLMTLMKAHLVISNASS